MYIADISSVTHCAYVGHTYSVIISLETASQTYTTYSEVGLIKSAHHISSIHTHVQAYGDTSQISATIERLVKFKLHVHEAKLNLWT